MKLKDEMREAAAVKMERGGNYVTAHDIQAGGDATLAGAAVNAALAVIDEWEEVEVRPSTCDVLTWFPRASDQYVSHDATCFTILRRKQKPKPDVTELARRAVKEWKRRYGDAEPLSDAMHALAEAVDE